MQVYRYLCDSDHYHSLLFSPPQPVEWSAAINGKSLSNDWRPVGVRLVKGRELGDFAYLAGHIPVFSERAVACLLPLIGADVEVLPLNVHGDIDAKFFAINVTRVVDCLDRSASSLELFANQIMHIKHHVFKPDCIHTTGIFRIAGYELGGCYVSEEFKTAVEDNNLTGLLWEPLDKWQ